MSTAGSLTEERPKYHFCKAVRDAGASVLFAYEPGWCDADETVENIYIAMHEALLKRVAIALKRKARLTKGQRAALSRIRKRER
jgi:hypothetical protein